MRSKSIHPFTAAAAVAALFVAAPGVGRAETLTDTEAFANLPFGTTAGASATTLTLGRFDPQLGALTSIVLQFQTSMSVTITVTNPTASTLSFSSAEARTAPPRIAAGIPGVTTISSDPTAALGPGSVPANGQVSLAGAPQNDSDQFSVPLAAFSNFVGTGGQTFDVNVSVPILGVTGFGDPNLQYSGNGTVSGSATVTYTYTPSAAAVPEAGTIALLGGPLVLAALGGVRRRSGKAGKAAA